MEILIREWNKVFGFFDLYIESDFDKDKQSFNKNGDSYKANKE